MDHSPELLKLFANDVARLACTVDGAKVLTLLRLTNLFEAPSPSPAPTGSHDTAVNDSSIPARVGIWERKPGSTCFVRRLDKFQEWSLWANIGKIEPKQGKKRVVLIGESVARGYLYEPQYTTAMALEAILQSQLGRNGVEVIDLARISLGMEVEELAISALLLEPDAVIIFCGNNWGPQQVRQDIPCLATALQRDGIAGLKHLVEEGFRETVSDLIRTIARAYHQQNIPLIWIIPEFNLGDWRDPVSNAPHLINDANKEWTRYQDRARIALDAGDIDEAGTCAKKMIELDGGVCPAGFYILAECSKRSGDLENQRKYLETARDSLRWDPTIKAPRCYAITQKILREEAAKYGNDVVELPRLIREYLKGGLPDRRLFLDYCHLTSEGIQIAMAAAASAVLRNFQRTNVPWRALANQSLEPTRKMKAEAAFLAAVHNAHWYQSFEVVQFYCLRALELYPEIAKAMLCFIDLQTQQAPMLMSRAAEELTALPFPAIHHYLLRVNNQNLDKLLLDAVIASLKKMGVDASEKVEQCRQEHSIILEDRDLLDFSYCSGLDQPQEQVLVTPERFVKRDTHFRANRGESRFLFVAEAGQSVSFSITCRLPHASQGKLCLEVNDSFQHLISATDKWCTWDISVAGQAIHKGLNELRIRWPDPEFPGRRGIESAVYDMLQARVPQFYTSFGEIYALTVLADRTHVESRASSTKIHEFSVGQA